MTFSHVFLSARVHGEQLNDAAAALLARLVAQATPPEATASLSDPLPIGLQLHAQSRQGLMRAFGADFAAHIFTLQTATWAGPLPSPFGLHLVWVHAQHPAQLPAPDTVWSQVAAELAQDRAAAQLASGLQRLRSRYNIRIAWRDTGIAQRDASPRRQS